MFLFSFNVETNLVFQYHLSFFTGCVSADETSNRLFFSDCNHHRIIVSDGNGEIMDCVCILINEIITVQYAF